MSKYGCPGMFIAMVRLFHESMQARVQDNGTEPFPVSNGVKQGSVLAPTLFSLKFSAMLNDAFCAERVGVDISHRTDGQLFNPRRQGLNENQTRHHPRSPVCRRLRLKCWL